MTDDPRAEDATTVTTHHDKSARLSRRDITSVSAVVDPDAQEQVAGLIPAEIVSDRRDTLGKRLAKLGLAVLIAVLLGWAVNGIISTNHRLGQAERDRTTLITDVTRLARIMGRQGYDLRALRRAIRDQNKILRAAGLPTIPVPPLTSEGGGAPRGGGPSSTPRSQPPSSAPPSSPPPHQTSSPTAKPSPSSSPPIVICLPVVHCIAPGALEHMTVLDWEARLMQAYVSDWFHQGRM